MTSTPIKSALEKYLSKSPLRLHVPFHQGTRNNDFLPPEIYNLDVSEVAEFSSQSELNPIYQSEKITADFFNVKHSFYLTGGASQGIYAALIALRKFGKKILIPRNSHKSVINAVILAGLEPVWLEVEFLNEWLVFNLVSPEKVDHELSIDKNIAGCVITSPTYEGKVSDLKTISTICKKNNIPLIVDQSHGSHLYFLDISMKTSFSALLSEADIVIDSWHKSLGSLTQTAVLHLNSDKFSYYDLKRSIDLVSTTSPSFLLLLSLEFTRKYFQDGGIEKLLSSYEVFKSIKSELLKMKNIKIFNSEDIMKIFFKMSDFSGDEVSVILYEEYSIEVEYSNNTGVLILGGIGASSEHKNRLVHSLSEISAQRKIIPASIKSLVVPAYNKFTSLPRTAFFRGFESEDVKSVECKNIEAVCPPGFATKIPGTIVE